MKKTILILSMVISTHAFSQTRLPNHNWIANGSISSASLTLKFDGYTNGAYNYSLTNKQTACTGGFAIRGIGNQHDTVTIGGGKTKHFSTTAPFAADSLWAKALTNCSATYDTCYWGVTTIDPLAVNLSGITAKRISTTQVQIDFDAGNVQAGESVTIEYSTDAVSWNQALVFFPDAGDGVKHYSRVINIK